MDQSWDIRASKCPKCQNIFNPELSCFRVRNGQNRRKVGTSDTVFVLRAITLKKEGGGDFFVDFRPPPLYRNIGFLRPPTDIMEYPRHPIRKKNPQPPIRDPLCGTFLTPYNLLARPAIQKTFVSHHPPSIRFSRPPCGNIGFSRHPQLFGIVHRAYWPNTPGPIMFIVIMMYIYFTLIHD